LYRRYVGHRTLPAREARLVAGELIQEPAMANFAAQTVGIEFDRLDLSALAGATSSEATTTSLALVGIGQTTQIFGSGFVFADAGPPAEGVINRIVTGSALGLAYDIGGLSIPAADFRGWVLAGDNATAKAMIFSGSDAITGSGLNDQLRGYGGPDMLAGGGGDDVLDSGDGDDVAYGGVGNDTMVDPSGANYLRGEDGDDYVVGGVGVDDINGNTGADTLDGGLDDDWVVGGKDNDVLLGDAGADLVYGNLGDDTCAGGSGADVVRGGQGRDSLAGGPGDDYISGDRGEDTLSGGTGADDFQSFPGAGIDRILDFNVPEGDRLRLDPGTTYAVAQVGADTVITLVDGQVVLVGVSVTTLLASSVFVG
jgi:serralysin